MTAPFNDFLEKGRKGRSLGFERERKRGERVGYHPDHVADSGTSQVQQETYEIRTGCEYSGRGRVERRGCASRSE